MTESKGRVLVVSTGKELLDEMAPSMAGRSLEMVCVPTLKYAADRLAAGDCTAMVVDFGKVPTEDREGFLALHKQFPKVSLFTLETPVSTSPGVLAPLRRLSWPLPMGFADQARVTSRSIVILADQVLFTTGAVQTAFHQAGVQVVSLDEARELPGFIRGQNEARLAAAPKAEKPKNLWSLLGSSEEASTAPELMLNNVVVAQFPGSLEEAESLDAAVRAAAPETVCYFLSGMETARYAIQAIKEGHSVELPRDNAGRIAGILIDNEETGDARLKQREVQRILLLDNFKPNLTSLTLALQGAGYMVTALMDGSEALRISNKGAFHLAIIGTAITTEQYSGPELALKLRERDPDMRIIFMVEQYPLKAALQGVSQVVELGLDDALLKPIEASRLIFSVEKALERRFLMLENERLFKETQEQKSQLELINGFQKKFFATVAHDVKSPLTAIMGYSEVLTGKLKAMQSEQRYAANILTSAKTLNVLISDLVDLAAIESGKLRVEIGTLNLQAVIQDVYERVKIAAQKRSLNMTLESPPALPLLAGDDARVGQVVQNLCTNAIQYTKEGGKITIKAEVTADRVIVSVIDTGIGISKEDLPRVWERFFQTKEAQGMRKAGFGLGLKIAREIVQRHGGEMGIESELGVGSRFFFHIPLKSPVPAPAPAAPTAPAPPSAPPAAPPPPPKFR